MSAEQPGALRRWGWHRLDADWARRIVESAGIEPGARVVEIGADTGVLTAALVAAGAEVLAVELHPERVRQLRFRFAGDPVTIVAGDVLDFRWPRTAFRVVANPPFGITAALLRALLAQQNTLQRADLVLQRGVVSKYASSNWASRWFTASRGIVVPRSAFSPRPRVDTAVLTLTRRTR